MQDVPLISVVIPAYNHERYVADCVASVMAQDWPRMELLIVDDGSKDGTWDRIREVEAKARESGKFERVEVATQENQGTCMTLNRLCGMARGDVVAMIASDDKYLPGAFTAMMGPMLADGSVGVVVGQNLLMDEKGVRIYWDRELKAVYRLEDAEWRSFSDHFHKALGLPVGDPRYGRYETFLKYNHVANGYLIRKTFLDRILPYRKDAPLEDYWTHLQLSKICRYVEIPDAVFEYRWHSANTVKNRGRLVEMIRRTMLCEMASVERLPDRTWRELFARHAVASRRVRLAFGRFLRLERVRYNFAVKEYVLVVRGREYRFGRRMMEV